ncbi:hypothetical protein GCM10027436_57290 [Actinophytocola sediminis]
MTTEGTGLPVVAAAASRAVGTIGRAFFFTGGGGTGSEDTSSSRSAASELSGFVTDQEVTRDLHRQRSQPAASAAQ